MTFLLCCIPTILTTAAVMALICQQCLDKLEKACGILHHNPYAVV